MSLVILRSVALDQLQEKTCLWENYEKIWSSKGKGKEHFSIFIFVPSKLPSLWKWIKTHQKSDFLVKIQNIISLGNIELGNRGYLHKKYILYTYKNLNWVYLIT